MPSEKKKGVRVVCERERDERVNKERKQKGSEREEKNVTIA